MAVLHKLHTFSINWSEHEPVNFNAFSVRILEEQLSQYLLIDRDFLAFLKALKKSLVSYGDQCRNNSELNEYLLAKNRAESVESVLKKLAPLTLEFFSQVAEWDLDDLRYEVGNMLGWSYQVVDLADEDNGLLPANPAVEMRDQHNFEIVMNWPDHEPVRFSAATKEDLDSAVSTYLMGDSDFVAFLEEFKVSIGFRSQAYKSSSLKVHGVLKGEATLSLDLLAEIHQLHVDGQLGDALPNIARINEYSYTVTQVPVSPVASSSNTSLACPQTPAEMPAGIAKAPGPTAGVTLDKNLVKASSKRLTRLLKGKGLDLSNAQALELLTQALFSKPYGEVEATLL